MCRDVVAVLQGSYRIRASGLFGKGRRANAVSASSLRGIKRCIRPFLERESCLTRPQNRHAHTHGDHHRRFRSARMWQQHHLYGQTHTLGHLCSLCSRSAGQQHRKLLTANPSHEVTSSSHLTAQGRRHQAQAVVTLCMAQHIVQAFEIVHVQQ